MAHRERAPEREEGTGGGRCRAGACRSRGLAPAAPRSRGPSPSVAPQCPHYPPLEPGALLFEKTQVLSKQLVVCYTFLRLSIFERCFHLILQNVGSILFDSLGCVSSVAQVAVEYSTLSLLLKSDRWVAGVVQQPGHLGLEPASKDVPRVVGAIGQIHLGHIGFAVYLESAISGYECLQLYDCDIEV